MRTWSTSASSSCGPRTPSTARNACSPGPPTTSRSAPPRTPPRCGHPGYVPDDYLEHLDGLGIETTITAAELCTIGTWERAGGGYRILDWEAVEVCPGPGDARPQARTRAPSPAEQRTRGQDPGPHGQADGGHPAVRGMRSPCSPHRARGPRPAARRMGPVARHRAGQHPAATPARTVVPPGQGHRARTTATATPSTPAAPGRSPGRSGLPCASPRSTRPGSTTMQDSARTAKSRTATSTGTCPTPDTATAPTGTARAWTRTGRH